MVNCGKPKPSANGERKKSPLKRKRKSHSKTLGVHDDEGPIAGLEEAFVSEMYATMNTRFVWAALLCLGYPIMIVMSNLVAFRINAVLLQTPVPFEFVKGRFRLQAYSLDSAHSS